VTPEILEWLARVRKEHIPNPGKVLEVGSYDINGSPRKHFQDGALSYLGVDQAAGPGVDLAAPICELKGLLKPEYDTILCCETLEHDSDPVRSVDVLHSLLVVGGHLILTSPANGFQLHRHPRDYWRIMPDAYEDILLRGMHVRESFLTPSSYSIPPGCHCYLAQKPLGAESLEGIVNENDASPVVVWHCAAMGDWKAVAHDQLAMLKTQGLTEVHTTFVGGELGWLLREARRLGVTLKLDRTDPNLLHYETFAILLIERMAKATERPFLYLHTKGVSVQGHRGKQRWRRLMEMHVIEKWRENLAHLKDYDLVGVNWFANPGHFCGNFWLARADWIRKLADFVRWHHAHNLVRTSCEFWIGSAPSPRALSLVCHDQPFWNDGYPFEQFGV
jgi:hypothetical protein